MNLALKRTLIGFGALAALTLPVGAGAPLTTASASADCFRPTDVGAAARGVANRRAGDHRSISRTSQRRVEERTRRILTGRKGRRVTGTVTVPVYVHVMTSKSGAGDVSDARIARQIEVLNATYAGKDPDHAGGVATGFRFRLADTDRIRNSTWHNDGESEIYRKQTRRGGRGALNIWVVDFDYLGVATFPWDDGSTGIDGIRIQFSSLPGGSAAHFSEGKTVSHETGHWLGLYHTFQDGCGSAGDEVSDTAAQASPSAGCPVGRDSCSSRGLDPIHNYMDYSYDGCYQSFSPGQVTRMKQMWSAYRS